MSPRAKVGRPPSKHPMTEVVFFRTNRETVKRLSAAALRRACGGKVSVADTVRELLTGALDRDEKNSS